MELAHLITALSTPAAYPRSIKAESVDVRQTHISVVFLAGPYAYKLKKPLALGFLDYSTPELPAVLLLCRAEPAVVRARLERRRDDASDADWAVYLVGASRWEDPGPLTRPVTREIATGGSREEALALALEALRKLGLW